MPKMLLRLIILTACFGGLLRGQAFAQYWGGADDVPSWNVGDEWDLERTFTIHLGGSIPVDPIVLYLDVPITIHDKYTLKLTATTDTAVVNNGLGAFTPTLAYVRERTIGRVDVGLADNKLALIEGFAEPYISLTGGITGGNSDQGYSWNAVGDLSQIRESFTMPETEGTLTITGTPSAPGTNLICTLLPSLASGVKCGDTVPFFLSLSINIDHETHPLSGSTPASGLELLDFPTLGVGEKWTTHGLRGIGGSLSIKALEDADNPGQYILDEQFDIPENTFVPISYSMTLAEKGVTDPNTPLFTDTRHIVGSGQNNDQIYYSPTAKELSSWSLAPLQFLVDDDQIVVTVSNFMTKIQNTANPVRLVTPSDFSNLTIVPPQPKPGQSFVVTGNIGGSNPTGSFVLGDLLLPNGGGDNAFTQTTSADAFSMTLTAPSIADLTKWQKRNIEYGDREKGSFGLRLLHFGNPSADNRKIITVRTEDQNDVDVWNKYE